jgi:O-antigen/teichoic acid export membrane protein
MAAGLASLAMHQMDRGLLRLFGVDLSSIGLYALAYTIAQAGNTLVLEPFQAIWAPVLFDVDARPDRIRVFRHVFIALVFAVFLVQTGLALASVPLIRLVAAPEYAGAAHLLPWLCLAFFFFPLHTMFRIPVILHRKTGSVAWIAFAAAGLNLLLNVFLIPRFGVWGACWASIATYAAYSFLGHLVYRRTEDVHFPLQIVLAAAGAGFFAYGMQRLLLPQSSLVAQILGAIAYWMLAGMALLHATGWSSPKRWIHLWDEMRGGESQA